MKTRKKAATFLTAVVFALLPRFGLAMNDTDGVIAKGLFPLQAGSETLEIISEEVVITVTRRCVWAKRSYKIRNRGNVGTFRIGTICSYNSASISAENCGTVRVNGTLISLTVRTAYLADKGPVVQVQAMSRKSIAKCLETVDGTICGHVWAYFETKIREGEVKHLELEYISSIIPFIPTRIVEHITNPLYLYTEKFWAGSEVPRIEVRLNVEGGLLTLDAFNRREKYPIYATHPSGEEDGIIVWRFKNYRPKKTAYSYQFRLTNSYAVDDERLWDAYFTSTKKTACKERTP